MSKMDSHMNMNSTVSNSINEPSYIHLVQHRPLLIAHIVCMIVSWLFLLPVGIALGIARSKHHLITQLAFVISNILGILFAVFYSHSTPDLYPNNIHITTGWGILLIIVAQALFGVISAITSSFTPYEHLSIRDPDDHSPTDSGHGSDNIEMHPFASSQRSFSKTPLQTAALHHFRFLRQYLDVPHYVEKFVRLVHAFLGHFMLVIGFLQIATGLIVSTGIMKGDMVYNGLAHFIKGGIFLVYGMFCFARYLGAFRELGWSWNHLAKTRSSAPTIELLESLLILTYGSTNIFLERLGSHGGPWSAQQLQHVSIAFLYLGGGLAGVLLELERIQKLLPRGLSSESHLSSNPFPALVIFATGLMMSSHHQTSMFSSVIHKQWGFLLATGAVLRLLTYMLLYLRPPTSPSQAPPFIEIVASFCLICGGIIFIASNSSTVEAMEQMNLSHMLVVTVAVGVTALIMAWEMGVMAIKGLAVNCNM